LATSTTSNQFSQMISLPNNAPALDGGIPPLLHIGCTRPAACEARRWAAS
jgi:hypothetical protein